MNWIEKLNTKIWRRFYDSASLQDSSLSLFRIVFGLLVLLFFVYRFSWVGTMPDALYDPPIISIGSLFSGFPGTVYFQILETVFILCIGLLTIGVFSRRAGLAAAICYFLMSSFSNGFGKIDHDVLYPLVMICLYFSNWGTKYALLPDKKKSFPIRGEVLLAVFLSFGMFTAGFQKAVFWIDFNIYESGFLRWFYNSYFSLGRNHLLTDMVFDLPPLLIELFDYFAVILEFTPFLALYLGRRYWKLWILIAAIFHMANLLLLNISFSIHILIYLPFIMIHPKFKTLSRSAMQILLPCTGVLVLINLYLSCVIPEMKSLTRLILGNNLRDILLLYLVLWTLFILFWFASYTRSFKNT